MTGFVTRRGVVWTFAGMTGGLLVAGTGSLAFCSRLTQVSGAQIVERLAETLPEVFEPERLARHWQSSKPRSAVADEILNRPIIVAALEVECIATRRAVVRQQFAEDFAAGHVLVADRLLVARSEYLIAALCMTTDTSA